MTEVFFPFDQGAGANVAEASWRKMARLWIPTGPILGEDLQLEVFADSSGMQVKVRTGKGWIRGHYYETDATLTKSIAASDPTNPRDDRVVLRADFVNNLCEVAVLTGTPNASPTPPALTQSTSKWEVSLAIVRVDALVSTIAAGKVTDERQLVNPHPLQVVRRALTDSNTSSDNTVNDDDTLFFWVGASEAWEFRGRIRLLGTGGGGRWTFTAPSGASGGWSDILENTGNVGAAVDDSFAGEHAFTANAAGEAILVSGVVAAGSTAGLLRFRWAQQASNATASTRRAQSFLVGTRLA